MVKLSRFLPEQRQPFTVFYKKAVLESFKKFTWKQIYNNLFLSSGRTINLILKSLLYRPFPVNFSKYLRHFFCRAPLGECFDYISFCSLSQPQPKNVTLNLVFLFPLNIFRANNVDDLHVAISGVPRQLIVTELIYC